MQRCPKCGYNEGRDWPYILALLAFGVVLFVAGTAPKRVELASGIGMFLFLASFLWKHAREDKDRVEYSKLDLPVAERSEKI